MLEDDEDFDALTLHFIRLTNGRGLGHCWMAHQARLDLHGAEAMAAHFDHIIHTALDTEVAIAIFSRCISRKVDAFDGVPIGLITSRVPVDGAHQGWPGLAHNQEATFV